MASNGKGERIIAAELARRLKLTPPRISQLVKKQALTRGADGKFACPAVEAEYNAWLAQERKRRAGGFADAGYQSARSRLMEAKAEAAERENALRGGQLIHVDDVAVLLREALDRVATVLKNAPSRHAPRLAKAAGIKTPAARRILLDVMEAAREELRDLGDQPGAAA